MRDKTIDYRAQAGGGVKAICDAIEGLKAWKRQYKEETGIELDISHELKSIKENLEALIQLTEGY